MNPRRYYEHYSLIITQSSSSVIRGRVLVTLFLGRILTLGSITSRWILDIRPSSGNWNLLKKLKTEAIELEPADSENYDKRRDSYYDNEKRGGKIHCIFVTLAGGGIRRNVTNASTKLEVPSCLNCHSAVSLFYRSPPSFLSQLIDNVYSSSFFLNIWTLWTDHRHPSQSSTSS